MQWEGHRCPYLLLYPSHWILIDVLKLPLGNCSTDFTDSSHEVNTRSVNTVSFPLFAAVAGDNIHSSEDKHHSIYMSCVGHCVLQGVAFMLLLGYLTFPFKLEVFVEIVDTFPRTTGVRQTQLQGFSKAVSIGLCLPDTWIDSRVIGNIHHSLPWAPECMESAFVVWL